MGHQSQDDAGHEEKCASNILHPSCFPLLQTQVASTEDTIVLRSTGGAVEYHGKELGEFVKEGEYNGHA